MKDKQAEREAFFDFYKQNAEPEEEKVYEGITLEPRLLPTEKDNPFNGANCLSYHTNKLPTVTSASDKETSTDL